MGLQEKVREYLLEIIKTEPAGTRLPSERDLADSFGVSRSTIGTVMYKLLAEGYIYREIGRGTFTAGVNENNQPKKSSPQKDTILFAYPDFFSYEIWNQGHYLELEANSNNMQVYHLKLMPIFNYQNLYRPLKENDHIKGAMIIFPGARVRNKILSKLDSIGKPIVLLSKKESGTYKNIYEVVCDNYQSGYLKAQYLLAKGHRCIGYVSNEPNSIPLMEQRRGMKAAFADYKIPQSQLIEPEVEILHWMPTAEIAMKMTRSIFETNPNVTALITDSVPGAMGVIRSLTLLNKKIPDDISLITSGEYGGFEECMSPALTTLQYDAALKIKTATKVILDKNNRNKSKISITPFIKERESVIPLDNK